MKKTLGAIVLSAMSGSAFAELIVENAHIENRFQVHQTVQPL